MLQYFTKTVRAISLCCISFAASSQDFPVMIEQFSAVADGNRVSDRLPLIRLSISNHRLVDDNGNLFNSYSSQSTAQNNTDACTIGSWLAYYTTFYVVLASDPTHLYAVNSCGKSPLQLGTYRQYPNANTSNFINHAQMAAAAAGQPQQTTVTVIAAGEMDVVEGQIIYMDNCSGHFKPTTPSMLAYMSQLDQQGPLTLTSDLKDIVANGFISSDQIAANFIHMQSSSDPAPKRNIRSGTGNCDCYTTVFGYQNIGSLSVLSGGLLIPENGNINIYRSNTNQVTNQNINGIKVTTPCAVCYGNYQIYVTTHLSIWNNSLDFNFTDETNDVYNLTIHFYSYDHSVNYKSAKPNIKKITYK